MLWKTVNNCELMISRTSLEFYHCKIQKKKTKQWNMNLKLYYETEKYRGDTVFFFDKLGMIQLVLYNKYSFTVSTDLEINKHSIYSNRDDCRHC